MEILTDATLSKLLAECAKYENYIGAILFESRDREAEFLNEIKSLGNDWTINVRLGRIKCKNNNSHIYTFTIIGTLRKRYEEWNLTVCYSMELVERMMWSYTYMVSR